MYLAENLKFLREQNGKTQGELAVLFGIEQKTISSWECGSRKPPIGTIVSLAKLYRVYYVIADSDREKYIERSILVNMTLLRKTASEKAQTGAILRVIRALLGIKGTYSKAELEKPFVVPTVTFAPDYTDPTVRNAMLQQGMNSMGNMFGASSTPPAISTAFSGEAFSTDFNPEDEVDNPAFASDQTEDDAVAGEQEKNWFDQEQQTPPQQEPVENESTGYYCDGCGAEINARVYEYSLNKFGRPLCMKCQKGAGK